MTLQGGAISSVYIVYHQDKSTRILFRAAGHGLTPFSNVKCLCGILDPKLKWWFNIELTVKKACITFDAYKQILVRKSAANGDLDVYSRGSSHPNVRFYCCDDLH